VTKAVEARALQRRVVEVIYDLFEPGKESQYSAATVAEVAGIEANLGQVRHAFATIDDLGIISRRRAGILGQSGKRSFIRLDVENKEAALAMLDGKPLRKPKAEKIRAEAVVSPPPSTITPMVESVVTTEREDEEVKAIAGPDAPGQFEVLRALRKDEAAALVEAARQYRDRDRAVNKAMAALREQGIQIRYEIANWEQDDVLENIGSVLPYIEGLERTAENALRQLAERQREIKNLNEGIDGLRRELRRHQPQPTVVGAER
jgi:hypothetical protein